MALDLSNARATVESILFGDDADVLRVQRRPAGGTTEFDESTGAYTPPTPVLIYEGVGLARDNMTALSGSGQSVQGQASATEQRWVFKVPTSAPAFLKGDIITVVSSKDARIVAHRWVVVDAGGGTYKVLRTVTASRWSPGGDDDWLAP